ncbi:MAG: RcpC/CpaB family pilus assembly protein [Galactobacter sp.]
MFTRTRTGLNPQQPKQHPLPRLPQPRPSAQKPLRRSPTQFVSRYRRPIIAALVLVAVAAGLRAVAPETGTTYEVQAPVRDLPAGHVLTLADLTTVTISGDPNLGSADASALVGRTLSLPWPRGLPVHDQALSGADTARHLPAGQVAVGLQPGRATPVGFIRPGDQVDVIVTQGESAQDQRNITVARAARVLSVSGSDTAETGWAAGGKADEPVIVVAVPRADAAELSSAPRRGPISLVVSG